MCTQANNFKIKLNHSKILKLKWKKCKGTHKPSKYKFPYQVLILSITTKPLTPFQYIYSNHITTKQFHTINSNHKSSTLPSFPSIKLHANKPTKFSSSNLSTPSLQSKLKLTRFRIDSPFRRADNNPQQRNRDRNEARPHVYNSR